MSQKVKYRRLLKWVHVFSSTFLLPAQWTELPNTVRSEAFNHTTVIVCVEFLSDGS